MKLTENVHFRCGIPIFGRVHIRGQAQLDWNTISMTQPLQMRFAQTAAVSQSIGMKCQNRLRVVLVQHLGSVNGAFQTFFTSTSECRLVGSEA
jgi:hypothetical protein